VAVTLEQDGLQCLIRLDGEVDISVAAGLKKLLLEALASGKDVRVDLEQTAALTIPALQLFWAAEREATAAGRSFTLVGQVPEAVSAAAGEAGFAKFPIPVGSTQG
jgi:anti-anti-sigma regulatory factor